MDPSPPAEPGPTGAEAVLEILRDEHVRYVFGNPGTTELPLIQTLARHSGGPQYVLALQEASAVAMADGYARLTRRPAFVNLHAAAGLGNGIGALTNAAAARVPLVVTAGQQDLRHLIHGPVLAGDLAGLAAPTVKWAYEVPTRRDLGEAVRRAFRLAQSPPTGPVFLALPMNLLDEHGPPAPRRTPPGHTAAAPTEELAGLVSAASPGKIALVCGDEVAREASDEALAVADTLNAPIWGASWPAANPVPTAHPLWRGYLPPNVPGIHAALSGYDLVLVLGSNAFGLYYPYAPGPLLGERTRIAQVTADPDAPGRTAPVDLALHGDLSSTLRALLEVLPGSEGAGRPGSGPLCTRPATPASPHCGALTTAALSAAVAAALPEDAVLVDEAPEAASDIRAAVRLGHANDYQWVSGGLGWAMPAAVGASLARGRGRVVCTLGDGAAMYSPQALWTAARLHLPITYVIANNREYRVLKDNWRQRTPDAEAALGMNLDAPAVDFTVLARSMGVPAQHAGTGEELLAALRRGIRQEGPRLIEADLNGAQCA